MNILGLIDKPDDGYFEFFGCEVRSGENDLRKIRKDKIDYVFQTFDLIPTLNVLENVEYPLLRTGRSLHTRRKEVESVLEKLGIADLLRRFPEELSGGQRQRVAIARAVIKKPALLLADEPTANLDSETGERIIETLLGLKDLHDTCVVLATHDQRIMNHSDIVHTMRDGRFMHEERVELKGKGMTGGTR